MRILNVTGILFIAFVYSAQKQLLIVAIENKLNMYYSSYKLNYIERRRL